MFAAPLALQRGDTVLRDGRFAYTDFALATPPGTPLATGRRPPGAGPQR